MHRLIRATLYGILGTALYACGNDGGSGAHGKELSGVYLPQGKGIYRRFEFKPGRKVAVTFVMPQPKVLEYVVMPDGRIRVFGDKVQTLRPLDDGCLVLMGAGRDGVEVDLPDFGRYCRQ